MEGRPPCPSGRGGEPALSFSVPFPLFLPLFLGHSLQLSLLFPWDVYQCWELCAGAVVTEKYETQLLPPDTSQIHWGG